ncbi:MULTISPECIES: hypothetical protein [Bacillus]|uniref:hypothetical protein n=1 Tax=Bacillus TaxID=1386 RepID=UPI0019D1E36C|nr:MULTISPECIES: hypothetical protein [Bacillus]MED0864705.1 hypothetical protein [Bacillus safensis]QSJ01515.1 hypothetical protein JJ692_02410 [Bacillus sp. 3a]
MKTPLGKLRLKLLEHQLKLKNTFNTFTVEEYHEMKQSLHEIRMTFAAYEQWDLYQRATDMITILLFQHALKQNHH